MREEGALHQEKKLCVFFAVEDQLASCFPFLQNSIPRFIHLYKAACGSDNSSVVKARFCGCANEMAPCYHTMYSMIYLINIGLQINELRF
jgi:hypothetical protein